LLIIEAFAHAKEHIFVGMVKYLDWNKEPVDNSFVLPFSKRASFASEQELRIAYWDQNVQEKVNALCQKLSRHTMDHLYRRIAGSIDWNLIEDEVSKVPYIPGLYVPVDIEKLVNEIYVSPTSPDWFLEVVSAVCDKFSLKRAPVRSDLLSSPIR
jgi:hypothetical protein